MVTFFILKAFSEIYQLYLLAGFAVLYLGIGTIAALAVKRNRDTRPQILSAALSERDRDRDSLRARP